MSIEESVMVRPAGVSADVRARRTRRAWRIVLAATLASLPLVLVLVGMAAVAASRRPVPVRTVTALPSASARTVYLTFDAGNAPSFTVRPLLALLDREQIKATFFLTGKWTLLHPVAARAIAGDGQTLASHSFSHSDMSKAPPAATFAELEGADLAVLLIAGRRIRPLYRPPSGYTSPVTQRQVARLGYTTVMWSKDPSDWRQDGSVSVASILDKLGTVGSGDVLVFHLRNQATVDALELLIPRLKRQGLEFETLDGV